MSRLLSGPFQEADMELSLNALSDGEELMNLLRQRNSRLTVWVDMALKFYKKNKIDDFIKILESSQLYADVEYHGYKKDQLRALAMLAANYAQAAHREKDKDKRCALSTKVILLHNKADNIHQSDEDILLSRAYFCLLEGNKIIQNYALLNIVLNLASTNIPSLLIKACISYNKNDFSNALAFYKKALRTNVNCPAAVRLGMAHCFLKLKDISKGKLAFERALQLDKQCVGALVALAILNLNQHGPEAIRTAEMLSDAYSIDSTNSMVLNHLANLLFINKDYARAKPIAERAYQNTENVAMRAESCYHIARVFHVRKDYDQAFQYYYQATQYASASFVLPWYGLGQMYIYKDDSDKAEQCFEKVLNAQPDNYDTIRILGSLYAQSESKMKRGKAEKYLKEVTKQHPEDVQVWIELAQCLQQSEKLVESLQAYEVATTIFKNNLQADVPPVILNNIAALHFRLSNLDESKKNLEESLVIIRREAEHKPQYYNAIAVTTTYNLARLNEALCLFDKSEKLYKDILKEHPAYVDCYLRLGCMARDKGRIDDASNWFKKALRINNEHPDALSLLGNLHLVKMEWSAAQRVYKRVLNNPTTPQDAYALIALGNVWLNASQKIRHRNKRNRYQERALCRFVDTLKMDTTNIWAANGIGAILAHKGEIQEARRIFRQIGETIKDFRDVWMNIAHIYVEQKQYIRAIDMYKYCQRKYFKYHNVDCLTYMACAYFKAGKLKEAKSVLLKARRVAPQDTVLLYNIALVLQHSANQILTDEKSNIQVVLQAVQELKISHRFWEYLSIHGHRMRYDSTVVKFHKKECKDLLSQAQLYIAKAKKLTDNENLLNRKQDEPSTSYKLHQIEEIEKTGDERKQIKGKRFLSLQEYRERNKKMRFHPISYSGDEKKYGGPGETQKRCEKRGSSRSEADDELPKCKRSNISKQKDDYILHDEKSRIVSKVMIPTSESDIDNHKLIIANRDDSDQSGAGSITIKSELDRPRTRSSSESRLESNSRSRSGSGSSTSSTKTLILSLSEADEDLLKSISSNISKQKDDYILHDEKSPIISKVMIPTIESDIDSHKLIIANRDDSDQNDAGSITIKSELDRPGSRSSSESRLESNSRSRSGSGSSTSSTSSTKTLILSWSEADENLL